MSKKTYANEHHPLAAVRCILLASKIIIRVEPDVSIGTAIKRAVAAGEGTEEDGRAALDWISKCHTAPCETCPSEHLFGPQAENVLRRALDEQNITFCRPYRVEDLP